MMVQAKYLALLDEFDTDAHEHEKGSLKDHLIGTHDLLVDWEMMNLSLSAAYSIVSTALNISESVPRV